VRSDRSVADLGNSLRRCDFDGLAPPARG
jgi:hypothetical protein